MNTIKRQQELHNRAVAILIMMEGAKEAKDQERVDMYTLHYADVIRQLTASHVEKALNSLMSEEEVDYVLGNGPKPALSTDLQIDCYGNLQYTPETK